MNQPKPNRKQRRSMNAVMQSGETKKMFGRAVVLALKVYEDKERVDSWVKTPVAEFNGNSPLQMLMLRLLLY